MKKCKKYFSLLLSLFMFVSVFNIIPITVRAKETDIVITADTNNDYEIGIIILDDGTVEIAECVCFGEVSIVFPSSLGGDTVTSIGDYAFKDCTKLKSIVIPNSTTNVGEGAFYGCTGLTSIAIPSSVTSIGDKAIGYYYNKTNKTSQKVNNFSIYGYKGTAAEIYANENGFIFRESGSEMPTTETPEPTVAPTEYSSIPTEGGNQRPINYRPSDSYTVDSYTPYAEEAIVACGGSLSDTQTIYFQAPDDWANKFNVFPGPDDSEPYMHICVYWWSGIGSKWPDGTQVMWVGYQAHLIDKENRIYAAQLPAEGTHKVVWNNGVNGGMDETREIFHYSRNLLDLNVEGLYPNECDTLPEGSPNEWDCDGLISIIDYSESQVNPLTGISNYGSKWYAYYGDGCYGNYIRTSDHFISKYENCVNPEHNHSVYIDPTEHTGPTEAPPEPVPTEEPWYPTECDHWYWGTYSADGNYQYYSWGYTYDTYTYCSNCGQELYVSAHEVRYADKSKCLNFDNSLTNWQGPVQFYVREVGGTEEVAWGSKRLNGNDNGDGTWSYDPSAYMNLVPGKQYVIVFVDSTTIAQTFDLLFDTTCLGDTAYVNPDIRIENPVDSNKTAMEARWTNSSMGPMLQITSIGNVVGETCPVNTTLYAMFVDFLKNTLNNARIYSGKSDQRILDDTAKALGLTDDDVSKAVKEAGVTVSWKPTQVTPTEPSTDSYGYVVGAYYLIGTINDDYSGTGKVHKNLRFEQGDVDYTLSYVKLSKGDKVNVAEYRGNNVFIIYPNGTGQEKSIDKSGYYTFYFKPYELGNPNRWYFTSSFTGEIVEGILGDADGNGEIESVDATFIQRWLAKIDTPYTKAELMRGDVDGSGDLELTDVTAIQYYLCHLKTQFPIGQTTS